MKKFSSNTTLVSLILGVLMILFGLQFFNYGYTATTIIGVFALVFGVAYLLAAILVLLNVDNDSVKMVKGMIFIAGFPLFDFVYYLIYAIEGGFGGVSGWILGILLLVASIGSAICGIVSFFVKSEVVAKVLRLLVLLFVCLLIVIIIFPLNGVPSTIGDIAIVEVAFIVCYFVLAKSVIDQPQDKEEAK